MKTTTIKDRAELLLAKTFCDLAVPRISDEQIKRCAKEIESIICECCTMLYPEGTYGSPDLHAAKHRILDRFFPALPKVWCVHWTPTGKRSDFSDTEIWKATNEGLRCDLPEVSIFKHCPECGKPRPT